MNILGIETSCDETAVSIIKGNADKIKVLSDIVSSQIKIHKKYGGVVPEVAARKHVEQILPTMIKAFKKAKILRPLPADKKLNLDAIAVTIGPGLITSLMVGIETAKTLAYTWNIPVIGINHIEGHIYANFIDNIKIKFPALVLTISGGHTMLVLMKDHGKYKTIGETRDDAAGEAFDKAAKLMNIGYPGGPAISTYAKKYKITNSKNRIILPRPMITSKNYDFSFSGLKTALMYEIKKNPNYKKQIANYCYEFQQSIIDVLIQKTIRAMKEFKINTIMLSGGVSANMELRKQMKIALKSNNKNINFLIPDLKYCTDNAVMIATAGYYKIKSNLKTEQKTKKWQKLKVNCNLKL